VPRIPIYNLTGTISGQAGSTAVPQISQASTSGAIAQQTDAVAKGLGEVAKFASVVVKNESDRIIAQENLKYQTKLDNLQKIIQGNLSTQPELWMDAYENGFTTADGLLVQGRAAIISEIQSNEYKYDFIKGSVINQANINNLVYRGKIFDEYLKETKKQNLMVFEDSANVQADALGSNITLDAPEFMQLMTNLEFTINEYQAGGGSKPVEFYQEMFSNALSTALSEEYSGKEPERNLLLSPDKITNPNILAMMTKMDNDTIQDVFADFTKAENNRYKRNEIIEKEAVEQQKFKKDELVFDYYNQDTKLDQRNIIFDKLMAMPNDVYSPSEKNNLQQFQNLVLENDGKIPFNPNGDQALADLIEVQLAEGKDMTYAQALKHFPSLNKEQQQSINTLVKADNTFNYNNAKKYIRTHFGLPVESIIMGDKLSDHEQLIHGMTNAAITIFEELNFKNEGNLNFQTQIPKILEDVKTNYRSEVTSTINNVSSILKVMFDKYNIDFGTVTPQNISQKILELENSITVSDFEPKIKKDDQLTVDRFKISNSKLFSLGKTMGIINE
tara:strand:+ start:2006 stop:3682 length:1677 start_codon:yes stop_codon:yes gene_type:complete